jgi:hypothetical protein
MECPVRIAFALAILLASCSPDPHQLSKQELQRWTEYYEITRSTKKHTVRFVEQGQTPEYPWCAWSFSTNGEPEVVYNLNCKREQLIGGVPLEERILARHEVFHEVLRHHQRMCNRDANDQPIYVLVAGTTCLNRDEAEDEVTVMEQADDQSRKRG